MQLEFLSLNQTPPSPTPATQTLDRPKTAAAPSLLFQVVSGSRASCCQEIGCLLPGTGEFVFLGKCGERLLVTADVASALGEGSRPAGFAR